MKGSAEKKKNQGQVYVSTQNSAVTCYRFSFWLVFGLCSETTFKNIILVQRKSGQRLGCSTQNQLGTASCQRQAMHTN